MLIKIHVDSMKDAERLSAICREHSEEILLRADHFCVDPKSTLGVLAIMYSARDSMQLDTGDMILKTEVPVAADETGESLHDKLAAAGASLCVRTLKALEEGTVTPKKQGESPTAYASMLKKEMGEIRWEDPAISIERLIRGLNPWPSAYTGWQDKTMKIWEAEILEEDSGQEPGTVVRVDKDGFLVQTGKGLLKVTALQIPGKKRMEADAFLRGYSMEPGEKLGIKNS